MKRCPVGTEIQSIIFERKKFTMKNAVKWANEQGFKTTPEMVSVSGEYFRFRQSSPSDFDEISFRTINLTNGVKAIIGCPVEKNPSHSVNIPEELCFLGYAKSLKVSGENYDLTGAGLFTCSKSKTLFILPMKSKKIVDFPREHSCKKVFEKWTDYKAEEAFEIHLPQISTFFHMGKAETLIYDSDKWTIENKRYVHDFKAASVYFATVAGNLKAFSIWRKDGRKIVTQRGIVG